MKTFTAYLELDAKTRLYNGIVPGIPGAHIQEATFCELHRNLKIFLSSYLIMEESPPISN